VATIKDPTSRRLAPAGHSNLQIMTLAPREYGLWNAVPDAATNGLYQRDPEYRRRKEELAERLIVAAECELPGIRDHIDWKEAATPITQERFTQSTGGTSYGVEFACDQMGPLRLGPGTDIPGLYLAGASTPSGHGIGGVLRSGVVAASAALERDLFKQAVSGEVLGDPDRLPELRDDWDPWRESH
jgi:all-trans-retinol 13,14-reductase